jgi:hypothetical protein
MRHSDRLQLFLKEVFKNNQEISTVNRPDDVIASIRAERLQMAEDIHQRIFDLGGDKARTEMLIGDIQTEIAIFSDSYFQLSPTNQLNGSGINSSSTAIIVESVLAEMDMLYKTLMDNYPASFNRDLPVPLSLRNKHLNAWGQQTKIIVHELKNQDRDEALVSLLEAYFDTSATSSASSLWSSREIDYYALLAGQLYRLVQSSPLADFEDRLFRELIYLNFNSLPLINHYLKQIQLNYDQVENYQGELVRLIIDLRNLKSLPVHPSVVFQPGGISLKEILCGAIAEEITCVEHLQRIQEKKTYKDWPSGIISPFYFHVTLTLEQLTFLFRIMIEAGVVIVKKKLELFDFIAKHIGTTNKESLALRSIKNKFGSPSAQTIQKVKHMLLMLVNLINERYPA